MDIEAIEFWNKCANAIRAFFNGREYLEVHTPCLARKIIPESSIEIFSTEPSADEQFFLVPSPEVHIKKLLAKHQRSMFELARCFRSGDSRGRIHNFEFTMLEYYTVGADYWDSLRITEELFSYLTEALEGCPLFDSKAREAMKKPFLKISVDEAFERFAGFRLSEQKTRQALLEKVMALNLASEDQLRDYEVSELYDLVLVSVVEPALPRERVVAVYDYPVFSNTLSKRKLVNGMEVTERWECYLNGVELANCYSELRGSDDVETFFKDELQKRDKKSMKKVSPDEDFIAQCKLMPTCSGVALGFERLLMLLSGRKTIDSFLG